jgi:hypothetical protein
MRPRIARSSLLGESDSQNNAATDRLWKLTRFTVSLISQENSQATRVVESLCHLIVIAM